MIAQALSAGAVTAGVDGAQLRDVRVEGRSLVRRIGLVVRDERWGTLPLSVETVDATHDGAGVLVGGTARRGGLAFSWRVRFALDGAGAVSADLELRTLRAGRTNRAGLVVLLDPVLVAGARATWSDPAGAQAAGLPMLVGPQELRDGRPEPLVGPFEHLELHLADGSTLRAAFPTVAFELEDERNWTDGTFKLYGPPLAFGPRELREGDVVRQRLMLELTAAPARPGGPRRTTELRVGARVGVVPGLGVRLDPEGTPAAAEALGRLRPAHVRIDTDADGPDPALLARVHRTGAPVELAVHLADAAEATAIGAVLAGVRPVRVLVHGRAPCTPPDLVAAVASVVGRAGCECAVVAGTDGDFVDLNRARPAAGAWDGLVIPMCPQVHGRDDETIRGALVGMSAVVETARATMAPKTIHVSPLSMTPRSGPGSAPEDSTTGEARDRMARPATAAWLLAAVGRLGTGGSVTSVTAFADGGPDGLFDERTGAPLPAAAVLSALALHAGQTLHALDSLPDGLEGFASGAPGEPLTAWVANIGPEVAEVRVRGTVAGVAGVHHVGPAKVALSPGAVVAIGVVSADPVTPVHRTASRSTS